LYDSLFHESNDPNNADTQQLIANDHQTAVNLDPEATQPKDSLTMAISMSILYIIIFFTGVIGNLGTCIVILKNKYMRTATNYYLFSLSVSDLTLLLVGLPQDLFLLWRPRQYPFGQAFCVLQDSPAKPVQMLLC